MHLMMPEGDQMSKDSRENIISTLDKLHLKDTRFFDDRSFNDGSLKKSLSPHHKAT